MNLIKKASSAEVFREEPFTMAQDDLDFHVYLLIWQNGWHKKASDSRGNQIGLINFHPYYLRWQKIDAIQELAHFFLMASSTAA